MVPDHLEFAVIPAFKPHDQSNKPRTAKVHGAPFWVVLLCREGLARPAGRFGPFNLPSEHHICPSAVIPNLPRTNTRTDVGGPSMQILLAYPSHHHSRQAASCPIKCDHACKHEILFLLFRRTNIHLRKFLQSPLLNARILDISPGRNVAKS